MQKLSEGCGSSLARQGVITVVSLLVGLPLACGCILLIILVVAPAIGQLDTQYQSLAIAVIFLVVMFGMTGGAVLLWWLVNRGRAARLDAAFTPLGLQGGSYLLNGRQYYGQVQGRALEVYFYRGPTVELRLPARVQTRVHIAEKSAVSPSLQRLFGNLPPLALPAPWPADWAAFALDPDWARELLCDPRVLAALRVLMGQGAPWALIRQVEVQPGEVLLHLYRNRQVFAYPIASQDAGAWVSALLTLAQVAEGLPAPRVKAVPGNHNRAARMKINRSLNIIVLGLVIGFPLIAGLLFLAAILLAG